MERSVTTPSIFALGAFFVLSVAGAQQPPDPSVPEDARDEQTMVPENADDDVTRGEDADDTAAATADAAAEPTTSAPAANQAATATRQAAAPAAQTSAPAAQAAEPATQLSAPPAVASPSRVIIVPARRADPSTDGCWARLHGASEAPGDNVTIVGPIDMPQLRGPFGLEWDDRIGSVEAGPRATVSLFGDERYEDLATTVAPGRRLASTGGEIESLRIACSRSATG